MFNEESLCNVRKLVIDTSRSWRGSLFNNITRKHKIKQGGAYDKKLKRSYKFKPNTIDAGDEYWVLTQDWVNVFNK